MLNDKDNGNDKNQGSSYDEKAGTKGSGNSSYNKDLENRQDQSNKDQQEQQGKDEKDQNSKGCLVSNQTPLFFLLRLGIVSFMFYFF